MKKREFEMLIKKIKSANKNEQIKLRELGDAYTKYLKSQYSDEAIKMVERFVLSKYDKENLPPVELHKVFLQAAKYYREIGMYADAERILDTISSSPNISVLIQIKMEKDLIKIRESAENGEINQEALDDIKKIIENDEANELDTAHSMRFTEYDLLTSYFGSIPVEMLDSDIFPPDMIKPRGTREGTDIHVTRNNQYIEALSAEKRLQFFKENFQIERIRLGRDKFAGTIIFEIKDSELVIAENFYRIDRDGHCVEDYGKATYILPKEIELDLIELSRGKLKEKVGEEGRISTISHNSETYYERLIARFNLLQNGENERITLESPQLDEDAESQSREKENQTDNEQAYNRKQEIRKQNEIFLNDNLGDFITPKVMEGLLNKASYSFKNLYNNKLKQELIDRLEILEIPEEQRELEAIKVFLYMRMTKNMSMIANSMIKGHELESLLDMSACEYEDAMKFYIKHRDDEITYNELVKGMKQFIETKIDPFVSIEAQEEQETEIPQEAQEEQETEIPQEAQEGQETEISQGAQEEQEPEISQETQEEQEPEIPQEAQKEQEPEIPQEAQEGQETEIPQEAQEEQETEIPQETQEEQEPEEKIFGKLVSDKIKGNSRSKVIDMATAFAKLIERLNDVTSKLERANVQIAELQEIYNEKVKATKEAKRQEELARQATEQAIVEEAMTENNVKNAQQIADELKKEQEELQEKLLKIENLLE